MNAAFETLAAERRWLNWRNEKRGNDDRLTKVPYQPSALRAKADDPSTWTTRAAVEAGVPNVVNGLGGGIGIVLGDLGDGSGLGGIDLDTCRNEDGTLEAWAAEVIQRFGSYTEVSPSGTGVKIFFRHRMEDLASILPIIGRDGDKQRYGRSFKRGGLKNHPPAIELFLNLRFFTVTEQHLAWTSGFIATIAPEKLVWLLKDYGPAFAARDKDNGNKKKTKSGGRDNSRSAAAYRLGRELRRAGATFEEMCDALRTDPETDEWYKEKGDKRQLQRIWDKAEKSAGRNLPIINLGGGKLPMNIDAAEGLLIQHDPEVYQRGDMVVRAAKELVTVADHRQALAMRMVPIKAVHLVDRLTRVVDFKRYDARSEEWVSTNCPFDLATAYLERVGDWKLSILTGIIDAPTLRSDGSVLDQPGYDEPTGILYVPSGSYYAIGSDLTQKRARAALDALCKLLKGFPFVDENGEDATSKSSPSRSVALSAILTAITRRSIAHAPLHAFTAPVMGSGKSKLVDIASMIATGHEAPVLSQGKTEEEMEKRLGAALIAGDALISFDNCEQPLGGELLCQALTQRTLKVRPLGKSMLVSLPTDALFAATGNNLIIAGDMTRRTIVATLDPKVERPELREFDADPLEIIRADRATYVAAALTVLRAFIDAGMPAQGAKPLGSFGDWSRKVRDALLWMGEPDPCLTMERARVEDPQTQALVEVLTQWVETIGDHGVSVKRAIEYANEQTHGNGAFDAPESKNADLREALLAVAGDRGAISSMRLAKYLSRNKGKIVNGLRIEQDLTVEHGGAARWRVTQG